MMNSKIFIAAFFFLLIIVPSGYAASSILSPKSGDSFNLGDSIVITGRITLSQDVPGAKVIFYAYSHSKDQTIQITTKYYSFLSGTPVSFSLINEGTLTLLVPQDIEDAGDWRIVVAVYKDNTKIEEAQSMQFGISRELDLSLSASKKNLNLGETLELVGTVLDARGVPVRGSASVSLEEESLGTVLTDTLVLEEGYLHYSYTFKSGDPKGRYTIKVSVQDTKGNSGSSDISNIMVSTELRLTCNMNRDVFSPNETVTLVGTVKDMHNSPLNGININSLVTEPAEKTSTRYTTDSDANGNYAFGFPILNLALPGTYSVKITAIDEKGNSGVCTTLFEVVSKKHLVMELSLNESWYYLKDNMGLSLNLNNKGNIELIGDVELFVDSQKVLTKAFDVPKGESAQLLVTWPVSGTIGNHTIRAVALAGKNQLYETQPQTFTIEKRPELKKFKFSWVHGIILLVLILIMLVFYLKKQEIKEYFWHRELEKHFDRKKRFSS